MNCGTRRTRTTCGAWLTPFIASSLAFSILSHFFLFSIYSRHFPGIGEFQCYDRYALASLAAAATAAGHPEWGRSGPHDAGTYTDAPESAPFFRSHDGGWSTSYGRFFLSWYASQLETHADKMLGSAAAVFGGIPGLHVAGKLPGVHWCYATPSHAAEATAGIHNCFGRDGYSTLMRIFARHGACLDFTCVEMKDAETPAGCAPEPLLTQARAFTPSHLHSFTPSH